MSDARVLFSAGSLLRFWARVRRDGDCWVWRGAVTSSGYGCVGLSGVQGAHRIAWVWKHGTVPAGILRNECGNTLCVNPAHWRDEVKVVVSRVRDRHAEIERLAREGMGIGDIADRVGCSRVTVWRVVSKLVLEPPLGEDDAELRS